jgi:hypothetical protein
LDPIGGADTDLFEIPDSGSAISIMIRIPRKYKRTSEKTHTGRSFCRQRFTAADPRNFSRIVFHKIVDNFVD